MILDANVDHRQSADETRRAENPCRDKDVHKPDAMSVSVDPCRLTKSIGELTEVRHRPRAKHQLRRLTEGPCLKIPKVKIMRYVWTFDWHSQNPVKYASLAGSFDIAPMIQ